MFWKKKKETEGNRVRPTPGNEYFKLRYDISKFYEVKGRTYLTVGVYFFNFVHLITYPHARMSIPKSKSTLMDTITSTAWDHDLTRDYHLVFLGLDDDFIEAVYVRKEKTNRMIVAEIFQSQYIDTIQIDTKKNLYIV